MYYGFVYNIYRVLNSIFAFNILNRELIRMFDSKLLYIGEEGEAEKNHIYIFVRLFTRPAWLFGDLCEKPDF